MTLGYLILNEGQILNVPLAIGVILSVGAALFFALSNWYFGSLLGSLAVYLIAGKKEAGKPLTVRQIVKVIPLSVTIVTSVSMLYWAKTLAPITVLQPIQQVAEMILPTLLGLYLFKEVKHLTRLDKVVFAVGIAGGLIVALSYGH